MVVCLIAASLVPQAKKKHTKKTKVTQALIDFVDKWFHSDEDDVVQRPKRDHQSFDQQILPWLIN